MTCATWPKNDAIESLLLKPSLHSLSGHLVLLDTLDIIHRGIPQSQRGRWMNFHYLDLLGWQGREQACNAIPSQSEIYHTVSQRRNNSVGKVPVGHQFLSQASIPLSKTTTRLVGKRGIQTYQDRPRLQKLRKHVQNCCIGTITTDVHVVQAVSRNSKHSYTGALRTRRAGKIDSNYRDMLQLCLLTKAAHPPKAFMLHRADGKAGRSGGSEG
jgi:hypothetical protein